MPESSTDRLSPRAQGDVDYTRQCTTDMVTSGTRKVL